MSNVLSEEKKQTSYRLRKAGLAAAAHRARDGGSPGNGSHLSKSSGNRGQFPGLAAARAPSFDDTSRYLMISSGLPDRRLAGIDLCDQLAFELGFEPSTNLSHYEYQSPRSLAEIGGREGCGKCRSCGKSTEVAFGRILLMISTSCHENPSGTCVFMASSVAPRIPSREALNETLLGVMV